MLGCSLLKVMDVSKTKTCKCESIDTCTTRNKSDQWLERLKFEFEVSNGRLVNECGSARVSRSVSDGRDYG